MEDTRWQGFDSWLVRETERYERERWADEPVEDISEEPTYVSRDDWPDECDQELPPLDE